MNAVFELEVNRFRKRVEDFACLISEGKLFQPHCSRNYFYSNWFITREQQAYFSCAIRKIHS